ncbi:MAG: pyridoxal phosphate-dependent aminotransferase [Persicimonas sp.]
MSPLATRAGAIEPTLIRAFRDNARPSSLDLGIGQPDLAVAEPVRRALIGAVEQGRAPYSHNLGLWPTRQAIGERYGLTGEQVMVTCGVQEALAVAVLGLVEPGDEVLVPEPGFPAYPNLVRMAGATPVVYELDADADFRLVPERVEAALSDRTSAIILNSPSNPTGACHAARDLAAVVELLAERGICYISDEIYEDYVYGDAHASVLDFDEGLAGGVKLGGLSKSHHMMGWRIGWLIGEAGLVEALKPLHQHLVTCAPTPAQQAARVALERHEELFEPTRAVFESRRELACRLASKLPDVSFVAPQGAFYLFLDVRAYTESGPGRRSTTSLELAERLLDTHDVVVIPGEGFGAAGEGFLRVAYTVDEPVLREGFARIRQFFENSLKSHD